MSLKLQSFVLGPIMTNAYLLWDEESGRAVVVDPGSGPEKLLAAIRERRLAVEAVLLTHAHFDHIGGVEDVRSATGAPVYIHREEADWLSDPRANGSMLFGVGEVRTDPPDVVLEGGEPLTFLGKTFDVIYTPGHSPGSVSYYLAEERFVISGDVLFQGSVGRTDLPGGDYSALMTSIHTLMEFPIATTVYPGHGPETSLEQEQNTNPFINGLG